MESDVTVSMKTQSFLHMQTEICRGSLGSFVLCKWFSFMEADNHKLRSVEGSLGSFVLYKWFLFMEAVNHKLRSLGAHLVLLFFTSGFCLWKRITANRFLEILEGF